MSRLLAQVSDTTTGGSATGAGETGVQEMGSQTLFDLVFGGGLTQTIVMILLLLLSVVAVYIFIERFLAINKATKQESSFMMQVKSYIQNGDINSAKNLAQSTDHPTARMIGKGISKIGKPIGDIKESVETTARLEISRLNQRMNVLATISGAAPMIGFLGTVLGMMKTFQDMTEASNIDIQTLAPGMTEAMITTVGGLIVGIIAYVAYNYLVSKVETVVRNMQDHSIEFLDLLDAPGK